MAALRITVYEGWAKIEGKSQISALAVRNAGWKCGNGSDIRLTAATSKPSRAGNPIAYRADHFQGRSQGAGRVSVRDLRPA